jgi:hypothetical protein
MRFIRWNVLLATLLLLSAFVLPQTPISSAITFVTAIAVAVLALAAGGKPALRYIISALAVAFAFAALLVPGVPGATRVIDGLVAAVVFALSLVSPTHSPDHGEASPAAPRA